MIDLQAASKAYYEGNPIMSDSDFDYLQSISGIDSIGYFGEKVKHYTKLYSLKKIHDKTKVFRVESVQTPKLDGTAVSILYIDGKLCLALTRGDGVLGKDITEQMKLLAPTTINSNSTDFIVGEVVALECVKSPRNYAAGAFGLKSIENFKLKLPNLEFIAYSCPTIQTPTYSEDMDYLHSLGFQTVIHTNTDLYPKDGIVYRVDSNELYNEMGYTKLYPRGALALKERKESDIKKTILREVVWQVGLSGAVTPVAIFDPIQLEDSKVERASLHNVANIQKLGLDIGDTILVQKAGHIIPHILGVV